MVFQIRVQIDDKDLRCSLVQRCTVDIVRTDFDHHGHTSTRECRLESV